MTSSVQGRDLPEGPPHVKPKYYYFNHAAGQMEAPAPRLLNLQVGELRTSARTLEQRPASNRLAEFSTPTCRDVAFPSGATISEVPRFEPTLPDSRQFNARSYPYYLGGIPMFAHRHCPKYWDNPWVGYCEAVFFQRFGLGGSACSCCGCCGNAPCRWSVGDGASLNYRGYGDGCGSGCVSNPPFALDLDDGEEPVPLPETTLPPLPKPAPVPPSRRRPPKNVLPPPFLEPTNEQSD